MDNSIDQKSSMDQKSSQKQTVSMKSAFGFGAIALVVCLVIALGLAYYAYRSKAKCCMKFRDMICKVASAYDETKSTEAKELQEQGTTLTLLA